MNPYGITRPARIDRAALMRWNAEVRRSIEDYRQHPNSACVITECPHLAEDSYMCDHHHRANGDAAQRMRGHRRAG